MSFPRSDGGRTEREEESHERSASPADVCVRLADVSRNAGKLDERSSG